MKILVSITSYNKDKDQYIIRLLKSYESISMQLNCEIDIVLSTHYDHNYTTSNNLILNKTDYTGELHCWANAEYVKEHFKLYDYIIESDDDILITSKNILQYIKYQSIDLDCIPGFIVTEDNIHNDSTYIHSMLFNKPPHVSEKLFLFKSTWFVPHVKHSACYMIDKVRLENYYKKNLKSTIPKHIDVLDAQCTARSEIYYYFKKVINLNELDSHLVKHLPNKYLFSNTFPSDQYRTIEFWKEYINTI